MFDRLEGIWNAFRNALLVWEFLKSLNFGRLETLEFRPETFGVSVRHLESWNIFGNLGISVHSVFLVQVNNGYGTNSNHIRTKKPPLTRGTAGPEFPFRNSKVRRQLFFEISFALSSVMQKRFQL
jgi:hypothetical protein